MTGGPVAVVGEVAPQPVHALVVDDVERRRLLARVQAAEARDLERVLRRRACARANGSVTSSPQVHERPSSQPRAQGTGGHGDRVARGAVDGHVEEAVQRAGSAASTAGTPASRSCCA